MAIPPMHVRRLAPLALACALFGAVAGAADLAPIAMATASGGYVLQRPSARPLARQAGGGLVWAGDKVTAESTTVALSLAEGGNVLLNKNSTVALHSARRISLEAGEAAVSAPADKAVAVDAGGLLVHPAETAAPSTAPGLVTVTRESDRSVVVRNQGRRVVVDAPEKGVQVASLEDGDTLRFLKLGNGEWLAEPLAAAGKSAAQLADLIPGGSGGGGGPVSAESPLRPSRLPGRNADSRKAIAAFLRPFALVAGGGGAVAGGVAASNAVSSDTTTEPSSNSNNGRSPVSEIVPARGSR